MVACLIISAGYLLLLMIKTACALSYVRHYPVPVGQGSPAPVTVLQPILSGDPGLHAALEDNLKELSGAMFFWLVDEEDHVARQVTAQLQEQYSPELVVIRTLPPAPVGINPKLFKLEAAWRDAPTRVCVVLDDDTRLPRMSLAALVEALESAELSTGLPYYREAASFPGRLLAQFVNDNAAVTYLPLLAFLPPVSINGMCYAFKRETLVSVGGFAPVLRHLTDDLAVARLIRKHGGRLKQTPFPQEVETHVAGMAQYVRQMHRWFLFATLLVRSESTASALLIGVLQGIHPLLLWAALLSAMVDPTIWATATVAAVLVLRGLILSVLQRRLTGKSRFHLPLSLLSELLQPLHLLHAVCVRTIRWRSRHYRVYDNHRFESR